MGITVARARNPRSSQLSPSRSTPPPHSWTSTLESTRCAYHCGTPTVSDTLSLVRHGYVSERGERRSTRNRDRRSHHEQRRPSLSHRGVRGHHRGQRDAESRESSSTRQRFVPPFIFSFLSVFSTGNMNLNSTVIHIRRYVRRVVTLRCSGSLLWLVVCLLTMGVGVGDRRLRMVIRG